MLFWIYVKQILQIINLSFCESFQTKNVSKYLLIKFASNSLNRHKSFINCWPIHRVLYIQRPLLTWFFEDLNLSDIKNSNNTIKTSLQVMLVFKIWRVHCTVDTVTIEGEGVFQFAIKYGLQKFFYKNHQIWLFLTSNNVYFDSGLRNNC